MLDKRLSPFHRQETPSSLSACLLLNLSVSCLNDGQEMTCALFITMPGKCNGGMLRKLLHKFPSFLDEKGNKVSLFKLKEKWVIIGSLKRSKRIGIVTLYNKR